MVRRSLASALGIAVWAIACGSKYGEEEPAPVDPGPAAPDASGGGGDSPSGTDAMAADAVSDRVPGTGFCAARQGKPTPARYCADFDDPASLLVLWDGPTPTMGLRLEGAAGLASASPTTETSPPNALDTQAPAGGPAGGAVAFSVRSSAIVDVTFSVKAVGASTIDVMQLVFDNQAVVSLRLSAMKGASIVMQPPAGAGASGVGLDNSPSFAIYRRVNVRQDGAHILVQVDGAKVVEGDYPAALPVLPRAFEVHLGAVKTDGPATVHVDDIVVE